MRLLLLLVWLGRGVHPDHLRCPRQGRRSSLIVGLGLCSVLLYHQRDKKVVMRAMLDLRGHAARLSLRLGLSLLKLHLLDLLGRDLGLLQRL